MSVHPPSHRGDFIFLVLLEALAAVVAARDDAQGGGDDDNYSYSCDEFRIVGEAAVIRGAGAADFLVSRGVIAPPLVVLLADIAAISRVEVVIS